MRKVAFAAVFLSLVPTLAHADDPKFVYGKPDDDKGKDPSKIDEWKASVQAGLILTSGNSQATSLSGGLLISHKRGMDKLTLELNGAFAHSQLIIGDDLNGNGTIGPDEIERIDQTTTKNFAGRLRYDRFFTGSDSAFLTARAGVDEPAGKQFFGGGQIGYSRQIFKDEIHLLTAEIGYDYTHEAYVANSPSLDIHSARLFAGYNATLSADSGFLMQAEVLMNLNSEDNPAGGTISTFQDTRVNAKTAVTTKLFKHADLRFSFTVKYDNAPAPRAPFPGIAFDAGFVPLFYKFDTITEMALIVSFL